MVLGEVPAKPHTVFRDADETLLLEHCVTRDGFEGPHSILYYRHPPTDEFEVDALSLPSFCPVAGTRSVQPIRRHVQSQKITHAGSFLSGRTTLMVNSQLRVGITRINETTAAFFANGDGEELYFFKQGSGRLESVYGSQEVREHDYVLIPKSTPYRIVPNGEVAALVFEARPRLGIPIAYRNKWGQLSMYAPYTHRDFRGPERLLQVPKKGKSFRIVRKLADHLTVHEHAHFPFDIRGWDGILYPVCFNIHDFQPKTGLIHLPPTIHTTFSGPGFVVCSFVPRMVDYHEKAIPCPYGHANDDMDEIIYYVEGNFTSRKGIESESISLHPQGIAHGPHPGTYEKSIGSKRTEELAVMCDTHEPFQLTEAAIAVEDESYHKTWSLT